MFDLLWQEGLGFRQCYESKHSQKAKVFNHRQHCRGVVHQKNVAEFDSKHQFSKLITAVLAMLTDICCNIINLNKTFSNCEVCLPRGGFVGNLFFLVDSILSTFASRASNVLHYYHVEVMLSSLFFTADF